MYTVHWGNQLETEAGVENMHATVMVQKQKGSQTINRKLGTKSVKMKMGEKKLQSKRKRKRLTGYNNIAYCIAGQTVRKKDNLQKQRLLVMQQQYRSIKFLSVVSPLSLIYICTYMWKLRY